MNKNYHQKEWKKAGLTKIFVDVWVLLKQYAVDLELEFLDFFALLVVVHSQSKLVAIVREVERDIECLG